MKRNLFRNLLLFFLFSGLVSSCNSDDDATIDEVVGNKPPLELCDLLSMDGDLILTNDPERPVDYIVSCKVTIERRKLIIEPGTVLEFTDNGRISVERHFDDHSGAIIAKGTASQPIIFRGTSQTKGHWRGIFIGTNNNQNELDYVVIRDAGKEPYTYGGQAGLLLGNGGAGYGNLKLTNSTLTNNRKYGLQILQKDDSTAEQIIIRDNVFTENEAPAYATQNSLRLLHSSNGFTGNDRDEIDVLGAGNSTDATSLDGTWYNHNVPYIFSSSSYLLSKITIEEGTVLKFPSASKLQVSYLPAVNRQGGLIAKGTPNNPILFTGTENTMNFWDGIVFESPYPNNEISHAIIEYTGLVSNPQHIVVEAGDPCNFTKINNIQFRNSNKNQSAIWLKQTSIWCSLADIDLETIIVESGHTRLRNGDEVIP